MCECFSLTDAAKKEDKEERKIENEFILLTLMFYCKIEHVFRLQFSKQQVGTFAHTPHAQGFIQDLENRESKWTLGKKTPLAGLLDPVSCINYGNESVFAVSG